MREARPWTSFEHVVVVGTGPDRFAEVRERLLTWRIHHDAHIEVLDAPPRAVPGAVVRQRFWLFPLRIIAPVKLRSVIDEERRAGFTYTTLPGHPEEGVEDFFVDLRDSGEVTFTIRARSRPALWWSRLGAPVSLLAQRWITRRYLEAAAR